MDSLLTGTLLAFIAGFADTASFVGADKIFCAHVTGNFVILAADLARRARTDEFLKLATFPLFVCAVLGATWFHRRRGAAEHQRSTRVLFAVIGALLGVAATTALVIATAGPGTGRVIVVALLVTAMGIQNAIHRLSPPFGPMTTVMTGNVTQWIVETMIPGDAGKHRRTGWLLVGFAVGCLCGGFSVFKFGFVVLFVPAALAFMLCARRE